MLSWTQDTRGRIKITVAAANGSGKSERIIPCAALRWLSVSEKGRVVITSADGKQIDNQVMPGLEKQQAKFKGWKWKHREIESPKGGKIVAFTTDEAGRMEGWHCDLPDSPLMIIVDEAKTVPDSIYSAIDRCTFNVLILISSTGLEQGRFYDSHRNHEGWLRKVVTYKDCPHIQKEKIADLLKQPDNPLTRSILFSEFMSFDDATSFFVTLSDIDNCILSPPYLRSGDTAAFCDFAGGGDENVLAIRRGNKVELIRCWKDTDEMRAVGTFIRLFREQGLTADQIWADNAGAGKPMIARFHELGWEINRFNGGTRAQNDQEYYDRNTEVWEEAGRAIKKGEVSLPNDPILHRQMLSKQRWVMSDGRYRGEPKYGDKGAKCMKNRGVPSPDRADAVMACIALRPMQAWQTPDSMFSVGGFLQNMEPEDELDLIGAAAGD